MFLFCINIPVGVRANYSFKFPCKLSGHMKGHEWLMLFTAFLPIMFYNVYVEIDSEYLAYYYMLSHNLSLLMSNQISIDEVNDLGNKLTEVAALREGLFPISEATAIYHQLVEIAYYIHWNGPIRNWWCFAGERSMGTLKRCCPSGGVNFDTTLNNRFFIKQDINFESMWNIDTIMPSHYQTSDNLIALLGKSKIYSPNKKEKESIMMEVITFLEFIVKTHDDNDKNGIFNEYNSSLYRLYIIYKLFGTKREGQDISFLDWIYEVYYHYYVLSRTGNETLVLWMSMSIVNFRHPTSNKYLNISLHKIDYESKLLIDKYIKNGIILFEDLPVSLNVFVLSLINLVRFVLSCGGMILNIPYCFGFAGNSGNRQSTLHNGNQHLSKSYSKWGGF